MANKRTNTGLLYLVFQPQVLAIFYLIHCGFPIPIFQPQVFTSICWVRRSLPHPLSTRPSIKYHTFFFKNLIIFLIVSCFINHKCIKHYIIWQITTITLKHEQHYMILVIQQMKASTYLKSTLWQVKTPISLEDKMC